MKTASKHYNYWFDFGENQKVLDSLQKRLPELNDNDILYNLQVDFLKNNDKQAESKLWWGFRTLCIKAVFKECKKLKKNYSRDEKLYFGDIATEYVLRRYKMYEQQGKIYIIDNFVTTAFYGAKHSLSKNENDFVLENCLSLEELKKV